MGNSQGSGGVTDSGDHSYKYAPVFWDGKNYERMHLCRVEGTNRPSVSGSSAIACAAEDGDALNILSGNYPKVTSYFRANGATISKDCYNCWDSSRIKNDIRWELQCPAWDDDAKEYPYTIQFNRVVYVAGHGHRNWSLPAGGRAGIQIGTDDRYLRLDDILRPLADAPDTWKTFTSRTGNEAWMQNYANRHAWSGVLTIVLDSCHSGAWIKDMISKINQGDSVVRKLQQNLEREGGDSELHINFRVSSLSQEVSWYDDEGGRYTNALLAKLRQQSTSEGNGYGTRALVENVVDGEDVVWSAKECSCSGKTTHKGHVYCRRHPQTDVAVDFRLTAHGGWKWWFPENRRNHIQWE